MKRELQFPIHERQPSESSFAWEAFCLYRDLGIHRSLKAVVIQLYPDDNIFKRTKYIEQISHKWSWRDRVKSWLDTIELIKKNQLQKEVEEMVSRHSDYAKRAMQFLFIPFATGAERWNKLQKQIQQIKTDPTLSQEQKNEKIASLTDNEFQRKTFSELFQTAIDASPKFKALSDMERTARGEPIEISKQDLTSNGTTILPQININVAGSKSTLLNDDV